MSWIKDASLSALVAGFVTVLVGYTSAGVIVFQAARALGANDAQIASWMWALGMGMGLTCIALSMRYRVPVVTAWSTPGAAMLITSAAGVSLEQATGAFIFCAVLIMIAGFSGLFERLIDRMPVSLASAMLAGVLLRFGIDAFKSMQTQLLMVSAMFLAYLAMRRFKPRYAVMVTLLLGIGIAAARGLLHVDALRVAAATPVWVTPSFSFKSLIGVGLPLFLVTMASQNVPGVAVMRASGFHAPISPIVGWTGVASLVFAPFGGYAFNLAAITAAICMGREAHDDPARRYWASIFVGVLYLIVGVFGATVASLFTAFPQELVLAIAGLALLGTIGNGLAAATREEGEREPALITFLVTASGLSLFGIGSAFWGLVAGVLAWVVLRKPAA